MIDLQAFFKDLKQDKKNNFSKFLLLLVLVSIPLHYNVNSIILGVFFILCLLNFNSFFSLKTNLVFPILLYLLMILSCIWSVNKTNSVHSLIKEIPLLLIPICFIFSKESKNFNTIKILGYYSYSIVLYSLFFLSNAIYSFIVNENIEVFFFHNLVTKELNAVHFSVFVSLAFFYFLTKEIKVKLDYSILIFLLTFLFLLSSKTILFTTLLIASLYFIYFSKSANKMRLRNLLIFATLLLTVLSYNKIKEQLLFEFKIKQDSNIGHTVINKKDLGSNIISMKEAWFNKKFNQTDYFSGSSFRVYQARLFFEFLQEEAIFWKGFGLNASYQKISEKGIQYNVYTGNKTIEGYQKKNFHNQYIQVFAELGVFGFLLLSIILILNIKNAIKNKDFIHLSFAILMISLFLTESFLWRQRGVVFFTLFYCLFNTKQSQ